MPGVGSSLRSILMGIEGNRRRRSRRQRSLDGFSRSR
jgi:hypothetical protein